MNPTSKTSGHREGASVEVRGLSRSYDAVVALRAVDLAVEPGEFVSLLGPSGCGKTTLLRCIAGLITPTSGDVLVDGRDITHLPVHRRELGMVFQSYALFPHMTVAENVGFGLRMRGMATADAQTHIAEALALLQMQGLEQRYPRTIVRRSAAARRIGALARHPPQGAFAGRAVRCARCATAGRDADRTSPHAAPARGHDGVRDA